jgi:hypothetical protein
MRIIEPYITEHPDGPRPCEYSSKDPSFSAENRCFAELILHTRAGDLFLCKRHASTELYEDATLMASAVIELSLSAVTV